ncbi:Guanine nucleotide-binding protein subunit alpha [Pseudohyphozyma bogoriensis]|nr:Guanine nucleotide-binding protein subunit alpha [Pseudohyphozyma bogoriensis]
MGCASSSEFQVDEEAKARNKQIEAQLAADRQALRNEVKLLILGTGESGKSTVMNSERDSYREIIFSNTVQSMQAVITALEDLNLQLSPANDPAAHFIIDLDTDERGPDPEVTNALLRLWNDPAVRRAMDFKKLFQLNDSAEYFFDSITRTTAPGFIPTEDDIIRARVRTTGIIETTFKVGKLKYRIFDVGGQRSERRKWINVFEGVDVLLFLVAISEYDQKLYEDQDQSRLLEAITVFSSVSNSRWFSRSTLILFLNKIDLFREKLPKSSLSECFPAFTGNDLSYEDASQWMLAEFRSQYTQPRPLYHHFTCATDTATIQVVINALSDNITRELINASGLV